MKKLNTYRVLCNGFTDATGFEHPKGSTLETELDLMSKFVNAFELVEAPVTPPMKESKGGAETQATKAPDMPTGEVPEQLGEWDTEDRQDWRDVSSNYADADVVGAKVLYNKSLKQYVVVKNKVRLNVKPLTKSAIPVFLELLLSKSAADGAE